MRRETGRRTAALLLAAALGFAVPAGAQTVRGTMVEARSERPIAGAFVILQDSTGRALATSLSGPAGTWLVRAPAPGTYELRVDRIGYASFRSDPIALGADDHVTVPLSIEAAPIDLEELAVLGDEDQCEGLEDEGLATYKVWEEARKALAAVVWTGQQPYYRFDAVHFQRSLDPDGTPRTAVDYEEVRYFGRHPFRSVPTQDLLLGGFVQWVAGSIQYYGPDADVMLSDDFLRRHCFRLVETGDPGSVGLAFEPVSDARVIGISGTMWLDATSSELRSLDFRYENLEVPVETEQLGGTVEFSRLPSGAWIVQHWAIRAPVVTQGPPRRSSGGRELPPRRILSAIDEGGGQVTAVFLTSRLAGSASTDTLPVRPPADSLIVRFPLRY